MKTAIVFKWARDPQDARISVDGELVWGNAKLAASDDDPAAMQVAKALCAEEDIVAVTIGNGDAAWAAARGAASTTIVEGVEDSIDASYTAEIIAEAVKAAGPVDAVVIGDSDWNAGVPVALMAALDMPAFAGVTAVEAAGDVYRISCRTGSVTEVVEAPLPFVLAVRGLTSEKAAPGMKQVLAARKKPQTKIDAASLNAPAGEVNAGTIGLPETGTATMIEGADAAEQARSLVAALKSDNVL